MWKLKDKAITEKELKLFSKDELIYCILHSGSLFNPLELLYEKRMDNNWDKNMQISQRVTKLLEDTDAKTSWDDKLKIYLEISKLNKTREKNSNENNRIMKILYDE